MLGVLCARPKPWHSPSYGHGFSAIPSDRLPRSPFHFVGVGGDRRVGHPTSCPLKYSGAASVWHTILPSYWRLRRQTAVFSHCEIEAVKKGEGSWNVAWDARPARWIHHADSVWLLFGVYAAMPSVDADPDFESEILLWSGSSNTYRYRVTGVTADGRCLFRAIAHTACLKNRGMAPDENNERDLADELRAQVVDELLKRRKEVEWFIDEEFDVYVKRMKQTHTWGGEPELLMCSYILRTPIYVFTKEKSSGHLIKVANYGEEYSKNLEKPINVLFHGYGHYDILEVISN